MFLDRSWPIRGGAADIYMPLITIWRTVTEKFHIKMRCSIPIGKRGPVKRSPLVGHYFFYRSPLVGNRSPIIVGHFFLLFIFIFLVRRNPSSCDCTGVRTHVPTSEGFEVYQISHRGDRRT